MRTPWPRTVCGPLMLALVAVAACGDDSDQGATSGALDGEITVFAASSLTDAFTEAGEAFHRAQPDTTVTFSFAASGALATQIIEGAPADVFASADESSMKKLTDAGEVAGPPEVFARTELQIIVGPGNPKGITGLPDLARDDVIVVLCDESVPCGVYARAALGRAAVTVSPASLEDKVRGVVSKVTLGEADAGIVYATDVLAAGSAAAGVEIPDAQNVIATYPISVTKSSENPRVADAFVEFIVSDAGRAILAVYGFVAA